MKLFKLKTRGFTLVELLVTISIIAILSAVVFASFSDARALARDKTRMASLQSIQLALEVYKAQNGVYPDEGELESELVPSFISSLPKDPSTGDDYDYQSDGSSFKVMATGVESIEIASADDEFARCPTTCHENFSTTYAVYSSGAEDW